MNKMREALTMAYEAGMTNSHRREKGINYSPKSDAIEAIAQRYGDLELQPHRRTTMDNKPQLHHSGFPDE